MLPFFPAAPSPHGIVDPEGIANEFRNVGKSAASTNQWSWTANMVADRTLYELGTFSALHVKETEALLGCAVGTDVVMPGDTVGVPDPQLWPVPYNRGWAVVGVDTAGGPMTLDWVSEYPELVGVCFSFQYCRRNYLQADWATFWATADRNVRSRVRLRIDGTVVEGSGPFAYPLNNTWGGTGWSARGWGPSIMAWQVLPAGAHTVAAVASQATAMSSDEDGSQEAATFAATPPTDGVAIGNRALYAVRFARGDTLHGA